MKRISRKLYNIASWTLLFVGIGDVLATDFFRHYMLTIGDQEALFAHMEASALDFMGLQSNMLAMYNGFSMSTGVLLFFIGLINVILARSSASWEILRPIIIVNMLVSVFFMIMCSIWLPINGLFVGTFTLVLFGIILFKERQTTPTSMGVKTVIVR